jgi:hypothetical protein
LLFAYPTKHNLAAGFSTVADNLHPAKLFLSVPLLSFSSLLKRRWSDVMDDTTQQVFICFVAEYFTSTASIQLFLHPRQRHSSGRQQEHSDYA